MKLFLYVVFFWMSVGSIFAQGYTPSAENLSARSSFQDDKFGMFIHWGASSVLGHGEWVMNNRNIHVKEYHRLINIFNPQNFDAKAWVNTAKSGGMKYITFITRHHDGFSNWDTKLSDWKVTNTPYGKDILKQLADECHAQGIKLYLYYSLLDWYRTDYQYETGKTGQGTGRTAKSDWPSYLQFMNAQMTELLTNYGRIDGIWLDGHWDQLDNDHDKTLKPKVDWKYEEMYRNIHKLQPHCLISNNHHLMPIPGEDFQAFEKDLPGGNSTGFGGQSISALPLETCETMNDSWGFNITDRNYKSSKRLIQYMVEAASLNANFLLNVGPMPDGTIQQEFRDTLKIVGQWLTQHGESYYGTRGNVLPKQPWGVITSKTNTYYLHIMHPEKVDKHIFIPGFEANPQDCIHLPSGRKLRFKKIDEGVFIYTDGLSFDPIDTIIRMTTK
jgi:alpha-L-fucosidase